MAIDVSNDSSLFIERAIANVYETLAEAAFLVVVVIFVFLGSARATLIPAITVPICLLATFAVLWVFGFSINLLTLLALVLAIRSEEHTSELQSLMRISYAVFCLKKKKQSN